MNNLFAAKLLSQLQAKKKEGGFTLIELLVVVIIIGILSAVALPQFLNQAARARQTEAEVTLGAINRAQQIYRLENPAFGTITQLAGDGAISIDTTGDYFVYSDGTASGTAMTNDATPHTSTSSPAGTDYTNDLRTYQAAVFQNTATGEFNSVICRGANPGTAADTPGATPTANADPTATACTGGDEVGS